MGGAGGGDGRPAAAAAAVPADRPKSAPSRPSISRLVAARAANDGGIILGGRFVRDRSKEMACRTRRCARRPRVAAGAAV
eukprot:350868-Chlamydomonas_euryale.AAC.8